MRIVLRTKTTRTLAEARPRAAVPEKIHEKEENPSYQIGISFLEADWELLDGKAVDLLSGSARLKRKAE